jgi:hypothetical protein
MADSPAETTEAPEQGEALEQAPAPQEEALDEQRESLEAKLSDDDVSRIADAVHGREEGDVEDSSFVDDILGADEEGDEGAVEYAGADDTQLFQDDQGNTYVTDEEGDYIPVDPETGQEVGDWFIDGQTGEVGEYEEDRGYAEGQEAPADPRVDRLVAMMEAQQINEVAEANPVVNEPDFKRDLYETMYDVASELGERASDPHKSPAFLQAMIDATKARRAAQGQQVPAEQARNQGAPLEQDAGASGQSEPTYEDQAWSEIQRSGGTAFPT